MKVANPTTRPRRTFDKDVEIAAEDSDDAGTELDEGVDDVADVDPVLLTAALRSWGYIKGVDPPAARFTDPFG